MILVDTSIWIEHFRMGDESLMSYLEQGQVLMHPFVMGELACGNLHNRLRILALLGQLPKALSASHSEVLYYIEQNRLMGKGIGYVDAHLLAAVALGGVPCLWTRDQRLAQAAEALGIASRPANARRNLHEPLPAKKR